MATLNGKAYTELSNAESSSGALDKAEEGDTVYLVGDANLTTAIVEGVMLGVLKDKMLTIDAANYSTLFTSEGAIRVNASGAISVDDTKMIGGNNANVVRNGGCRRHVARYVHRCRSDQQLCNHSDAVGKRKRPDNRRHGHHARTAWHRDPCRGCNHPDALLRGCLEVKIASAIAVKTADQGWQPERLLSCWPCFHCSRQIPRRMDRNREIKVG